MELFIYVICVIVSLLIILFVARLVFSIRQFLDYQKAQTRMIAKIAKQVGVDSDSIDDILLERLNKKKQDRFITEIKYEQEKQKIIG